MASQAARFIGFVGESYALKNYNYDCQRTINRYVEYDESEHGKDAEPAQLAPTPGLTALITGLSGESRGGYVTNDNVTYWVFGNNLYQIRGVDGSSVGWSANPIGQIDGSGAVTFIDNGTTLFIISQPSGNIYALNISANTMVLVNVANGGGGNVIGLGNLTGGSGYADGPYYNVPVTSSGLGLGCVLDLIVRGGMVESFTIVLGGSGYMGGDTITTPNTNLGGMGSGFTIAVVVVGEGWRPASSGTYIDGYALFSVQNSNQFYWTDLYSTNVVGFAAAETSANNIVGMINNNEDIWVFCQNVIELWFDYGGGTTGNDVFQRRAGVLLEYGCASANSIKKLSGTLFWLGTDARSGPGVFMAQGYSPQRISTYAIEQMLSTVSEAQLEASTADTYFFNGHYFYSLNVPGLASTLVFDLTGYQQTGKKLWHERQTGYGLKATRNIAEGHCYFLGKHIVGDYSTGNLYFLDTDSNTENGQLVARTRITPHVSNSLKRVRHTSLQIDYTPGTVSAGAADPMVMLQYSDDGGLTWSNERWKDLGKVGKHLQRIIFYQLGTSRNRVYKIVDVNNCYAGISGAELIIEGGVT